MEEILSFIILHKVSGLSKKFIELKRLSGEFGYVDRVGTDGMSLYVPILELDVSTFEFPKID